VRCAFARRLRTLRLASFRERGDPGLDCSLNAVNIWTNDKTPIALLAVIRVTVTTDAFEPQPLRLAPRSFACH
jgi:hypothetical protein